MTVISRLCAALLTALGVGALIRGSALPLPVHATPDGVVRLAWSARPERIENCRSRTAEELARVPPHMRQATVCEGSTAEYRLTVHRNGSLVFTDVVHGGGLRRDRRLYVLEEIPVQPGESQIDVRFDRIGAEADAAPTSRGSDIAPSHLSFSARLHVRPREVVLVTYSPERGELVAVRDASSSGAQQ
jgi:hypothetical protein